MKQHRTEAIRLARHYHKLKPVFLDTETTGFEKIDEIVEISIIDSDGTVLLDTLCKPNRPIPPGAQAVHGISDAQVADAPGWADVWPQVRAALDGRVLAMYNAKFDLRMLRQSCSLHGVQWQPPYAEHFCVMELFAQYYGAKNPRYGTYKWHKLAEAGRYFNIPEPNSHRAQGDTLLTLRVFEAMSA